MYSFSMFILTAALAGSVYPPRSSPLADEVQITVTADSDEYVAYEPVRLRVEVRNVTAREVTAYLAVSPGEKHCEIQYRRAGGAFVAFPIQRSDRHGVYLPHTLGPGGVVSAEYIAAFDRERGRFVLDGEGVFEFRAIYRDTPDDPNTVLESATISVRSHPVPASEAEHVVAYRNSGLGRLVQFQPFVGSDLPHEAIESAASFLDEHRDSLYARHVQKGLVSAVADLVGLGLATEREQALYETLRENEGVRPAMPVSASPSSLRPANDALVPVQGAPDVRDGEDPSSVAQPTAARALPPLPPPRATPLSEEVILSLSSDRSTYYPGERIQLRFTFQNTGSAPVAGHFAVRPGQAGPRVLHRAPGGAWRKLDCFIKPQGQYVVPDRTLTVGEELSATTNVSITTLEPESWAFLLDRVGVHEFQLRYKDVPYDQNTVLTSNVLSVEVAPVPSAEADAQAHYSPALAYVAQIQDEDGARAFISGEGLAAASDFVERFRNSRYTAPIRQGLLRYLRPRVGTGKASEPERALFDALASEAEALLGGDDGQRER